MQRSRKLEMMVGSFVLLGIAMLVAMTMLIRGSTGVKPYIVKTTYPNVAGLEIGSPVLVSGFRLGRVIEMEPAPAKDGRQEVVVITRIARKIKIYKDAKFNLVSMGFIGDKRLELDPGSSAAGEIADGDFIAGTAPKELGEVIEEAKLVLEDVKVTVKAAREFATDKDRLAKIDGTIANVEASTASMKQMLEENRAAVKETVARLEEVSKQSKDLLADAQARMGRVGDQVEGALADFRKDSAALTEKLDALANRADSVGKNADELILSTRKEIEELSSSLRKTSESLNTVLENVNGGRGTVGMLFNDSKPFEDLQASIAALRKMLLQQQDRFYDSRLTYDSQPAAAAKN